MKYMMDDGWKKAYRKSMTRGRLTLNIIFPKQLCTIFKTNIFSTIAVFCKGNVFFIINLTWIVVGVHLGFLIF